MQVSSIRVGVVGCGQMAQLAHLPCLAAHSDVSIAGLCDPNRSVAELVAGDYAIPYTTQSFHELLSQELDAVVLLTPGGTHLPLLELAIDAGLPAFVEKPAALSAESVSKLRQLRDSAGSTLQVGYMKRHEVNIRELLKQQREEAWGKLLFARSHSFIGAHWNAAVDRLVQPVKGQGDIKPDRAIQLDPGPTWLSGDRDDTFYSFENPFFAWLDTGIHSVNLLQGLIPGTFSVSSVHQSGGVRIAHLQCGGAPVVLEFCVNFSMNRWDEVTELFYEKASIQVKTPPPLDRQTSAEVAIYTESGDSHQTLHLGDNHAWAFQRQMNHFIESIQSGTVVDDLPQSLRDHELMEAIYQKGLES